MAILFLENLVKTYHGRKVVDQVELKVETGSVVGLLGPNGAGKTTIFNLITGIFRPTQGSVEFDGEQLVGKKPNETAGMGLARTFQEMKLWRHMTVVEHVKMACYSQLEYGLFGAFFGTPKRRREEKRITAKAMHLLETFDVAQYSEQLVGSLPYGAQRRVEMARAMATKPKILFLDEPTAGMTPDELIRMIEIIRQVHREFGVAIFLIEHRMKFVMELCQYIQTLVFGEVIAEIFGESSSEIAGPERRFQIGGGPFEVEGIPLPGTERAAFLNALETHAVDYVHQSRLEAAIRGARAAGALRHIAAQCGKCGTGRIRGIEKAGLLNSCVEIPGKTGEKLMRQ